MYSALLPYCRTPTAQGGVLHLSKCRFQPAPEALLQGHDTSAHGHYPSTSYLDKVVLDMPYQTTDSVLVGA